MRFNIEMKSKPNTKEYSDEIFKKMKGLFETKIEPFLFKKGEKRLPSEILVQMTNGCGYKVVRKDYLGKTLFTIENLKYFGDNKEKAEEYAKRIEMSVNQKQTKRSE